MKGTELLARYSIKLTNEFCQKMKNADVLRIIAMVRRKEETFSMREREKKTNSKKIVLHTRILRF